LIGFRALAYDERRVQTHNVGTNQLSSDGARGFDAPPVTEEPPASLPWASNSRSRASNLFLRSGESNILFPLNVMARKLSFELQAAIRRRNTALPPSPSALSRRRTR
jgi:hypothetical protein